MGMGMNFVAVSEEQLKEIFEDNDLYYEARDEAERDDVFGLGGEFDAINFLTNKWFDKKDDGEEYDNTLSFNYLDIADFIHEINEAYLDVNGVKIITAKFKEFTVEEFRRRFNSTEFKVALEGKDNEEKIYRGGEFGDESYFGELFDSFKRMSTFFINAEKRNRAILFYYV